MDAQGNIGEIILSFRELQLGGVRRKGRRENGQVPEILEIFWKFGHWDQQFRRRLIGIATMSVLWAGLNRLD
jgi:hypothetical protein